MQRLNILSNHFEPAVTTAEDAKKNSLSVVDNRTGNLFIELLNILNRKEIRTCN